MADVLRMYRSAPLIEAVFFLTWSKRSPDEALAMTYLYMNKYNRFWNSSETLDPLDPYVCLPFVLANLTHFPHPMAKPLTCSPFVLGLSKTLALASLSLASKATESPRRLRELLFPAHRLINPSSPPLKAPSDDYDVLRATVVQAELVLLRVLGFDLRLSLPLEFLPRYLERALADITEVGEDYRSWGREEREEYGVVGHLMETGIGRACIASVIESCKNFQIANLFPARTVAAACLFVVLGERGLHFQGSIEEWLHNVTNRKVDGEDFNEAVTLLKVRTEIARESR